MLINALSAIYADGMISDTGLCDNYRTGTLVCSVALQTKVLLREISNEKTTLSEYTNLTKIFFKKQKFEHFIASSILQRT